MEALKIFVDRLVKEGKISEGEKSQLYLLIATVAAESATKALEIVSLR